MSIHSREYDRPLGVNRDGASLRSSITRKDVLSAIVALILVAVSSSIAFRERPWRVPAEPAETVAAAEPTKPAAPSVQRQDALGAPAIIRVNPEPTATPAMPEVRDPATISRSTVASYLPDPALVEKTEAGALPIRSADGRRPFDVYSRPVTTTRGPRVAIVIGGLGVSQTGTQAAIRKLPPEVTLAFATGGNSLGRWMTEARRDNREILLQLPLEPFDYPQVDPGRSTLTLDASADENSTRLHWALARTTNYVGVMNYMGARFTGEADAMAPLMNELGRRGLMYLDDGSAARSLAGELAPAAQAPFARSDATIDATRDRAAILKQLDELEKTARGRGFAVGTGSAFDVTLDTVAAWAQSAAKRGFEIVPISALAADAERR